MKENIRIALSSIRSNKMRSFLTMLGIIIGVGSVIAIVTIGNSGKDFLIQKINEAGGQSLSISVNKRNNDSPYNITGLDDTDIETLRSIDLIKNISPMVSGMGTLQSQIINDGFGTLYGTNADYAEMMDLNMLHGRFFSKDEYTAGTKVCVVPQRTAERFFNTQNAVGQTMDIISNDVFVTLKVIGVIENDRSSSMFGDENDMQDMMDSYGMMSFDFSKMGMVYVPATVVMEMQGETVYQSISVTTYDVNDLDRAGEIAVGMLNARHNITDNSVYRATNMATLVSLLDTVINIFTIFISAVGAISLVVGGIGVMNIMLVSVTERTREIGIRKALGARTNVILLQFLTESVIICLIGGLIGMGLGFALSSGVSYIMGAPVSFSISTILIAVGFSTAVGIFFGIYPARKAAKMPPIEALRRNG